MKYIFIFLTTLVNAQSWIRLADFPGTKRDDGIAVLVNNRIYFGTGMEEGWVTNRDFQVLDINSYTWSGISPMPAGAQRQYANAFAGTGCFFIFGGDGPPGTPVKMYRYDVGTDQWAEVTNSPMAPVMAASSMVFGDKVIIIGGKKSSAGPCNHEVWEYTMSTNVWNKKNNFPFSPRWRASATVLKNKGYLLFGIDDSSNFRKELYRYDQISDTWSKVSDFPAAGRAYAAMHADSKKLVVFGGYDKTNNFYNDTWFYNDSLDIWTAGPSLPGIKRRGDMSCLVNEKFIYSCGLGEGDVRLNETWVMDVPLGLNNNDLPGELSIYPNPAVNELHVNGPAIKGKFFLTDMTGVVLMNGEAESIRDLTLRLDALQKGVYFLDIRAGTGERVTSKIIKE